MQIVLVRHADAESESSTTMGDFGRALTPLGRRQARDTAAWLASSLKAPHLFLTSPLVRAVQTAEICAGATGATLAVAEALRSGQSLGAHVALAQELRESTGLVGHEPSMAELAAALLGRKPLPFGFAKGACLVLRAGESGFAFESFRAPFGDVVARL